MGLACVDVRGDAPTAEFGVGATLDVIEPMEFTDVPYDATGPTPIADLPVAPEFGTSFPVDAELPDCDGWGTSPDLPATISGVVTVTPRVYFKADGCVPVGSSEVESDQKYYGSFFLQDSSGGTFVLGDARLASFPAGSWVTIDVTSVANAFDLPRVSTFELTSVEAPIPIYYQLEDGPLTAAHDARVVRVTGTVSTAPDGFGEMTLTTDAGADVIVTLDVELTRRGLTAAVGDRLQVTGPVLYSYGAHAIVVMSLGQLAVPAETP